MGFEGLKLGLQAQARCQNQNAAVHPEFKLQVLKLKSLKLPPNLSILKISLFKRAAVTLTSGSGKVLGRTVVFWRKALNNSIARDHRCCPVQHIPATLAVGPAQMDNRDNAHNSRPNCRALHRLQWLQNVSNPIPTAPGSEIAIFQTRAEHFTC